MKLRPFNTLMFRARRRLGLVPNPERFGDFAIEGKETERGQVAELFFGHQGRKIHKWVQYLEPYDHHFGPFRGKRIRMLEIGVQSGGSLELWRNYFGPDSIIYGVDIDPSVAGNSAAPNQIRIGSQADPDFLRSVIEEMGGVDIVLDDGSHVASHQLVTFKTLFPLLSDGGLYVIEDLQTAYWPAWEGSYRTAGTAIELVKALIDDIHHPYHASGDRSGFGSVIRGIHAYDSIAFIDKDRPREIGHTVRPRP